MAAIFKSVTDANGVRRERVDIKIVTSSFPDRIEDLKNVKKLS